MLWTCRNHQFDLTHRALIMGVVNVTPDSFSDGGRHFDCAAAVARGLEMLEQGADILDIGGESTRPGAAPVAEAEELRRVIPVLRELRRHAPHAVLSIDTFKTSVAAAALDAGADIINDVSGFRDPNMARLAAAHRAGCVVMHMQGQPKTMQAAPRYHDVVAEVAQFLAVQSAHLQSAGVPPDQIAVDPGIGFGKTVEHNLQLLRHLPALAPAGRPLLLGVSRKSFIGALLGRREIADRAWPTCALTSYAREKGARIFRVHDVRENAEALRMTEAILAASAHTAQPEEEPRAGGIA